MFLSDNLIDKIETEKAAKLFQGRNKRLTIEAGKISQKEKT